MKRFSKTPAVYCSPQAQLSIKSISSSTSQRLPQTPKGQTSKPALMSASNTLVSAQTTLISPRRHLSADFPRKGRDGLDGLSKVNVVNSRHHACCHPFILGSGRSSERDRCVNCGPTFFGGCTSCTHSRPTKRTVGFGPRKNPCSVPPEWLQSLPDGLRDA